MTEREMEQQIARAVRAAIAAHPSANAEAIADILAGPQARDPCQVEFEVEKVVGMVISDLGASDADDDTVEDVALAVMRNVDAAEIFAMAWLCVRRVAAELLAMR